MKTPLREKKNLKAPKYVCRHSLRKTKIECFWKNKIKNSIRFSSVCFGDLSLSLELQIPEMHPHLIPVLSGHGCYGIFTYSRHAEC